MPISTTPLSSTQTAEIRQIMDTVQAATAVVLSRSAEQMATLAARETLALMRRLHYDVEEEDAVVSQVVAARLATYNSQLQRGGTECVERRLRGLGGRKYRATTAVKFVPWLSDKTATEADEIINLIRDRTNSGTNPYVIARELDAYLDSARHNSETVARTESQKIRSDTRWDTMRENGAEYFEYVTAGDDRVRPEHEQRNGKIYAAKDAPYLGEYNCRCVLVPADYAVKHGAAVESSSAEIIQMDGGNPE